MDHVLPYLIESARTARDRQAASLRQAELSVRQALATLQRLRQFRTECLARSPASMHARSDGQALAAYQQFVGRLDEAIVLQRQEADRREARRVAQQEQLTRAHQRVAAFETLARRRLQERERREQRRMEREADEFAARAARRPTLEIRT